MLRFKLAAFKECNAFGLCLILTFYSLALLFVLAGCINSKEILKPGLGAILMRALILAVANMSKARGHSEAEENKSIAHALRVDDGGGD